MLPVQLFPSVAVIVNVALPGLPVYVPEITPPELRFNPVGSAPPVKPNVVEPNVLLAVTVWLYGTLMATFCSIAGNTVMVPHPIVTLYAWLPVQWVVLLSVAVTVKLKLPVTDGVPDTVPVEDADDKLRPVGKLPLVTA